MKRSSSILLEEVEDMPEVLAGGVLYVSREYEIACHLCLCGCGSKVFTPLGPAEWEFTERAGLPSLWPSIGNWALPCQSHYWISDGKVHWSTVWSAERIEQGRQFEADARATYYETKAMPSWQTHLKLFWLKVRRYLFR